LARCRSKNKHSCSHPGCNRPFLDEAISRGDDIALATIPKAESKSDFIANGNAKGMYGKELKYLVENNYKPYNISEDQWIMIKGWFK
jgi:hypothetical protein